jgi:hypothetical protein
MIPYLEGIKIIDYIRKIKIKLPENINIKNQYLQTKTKKELNDKESKTEKEEEYLIELQKKIEKIEEIIKINTIKSEELKNLNDIHIYDNMGVLLYSSVKRSNDTLIQEKNEFNKAKFALTSRIISKAILPSIPITYDDYYKILLYFEEEKDFIINLMHASIQEDSKLKQDKLFDRFHTLLSNTTDIKIINNCITLYNDFINVNKDKIKKENLYDLFKQHIIKNYTTHYKTTLDDNSIKVIIYYIKFFNRENEDTKYNIIFPIGISATSLVIQKGGFNNNYKNKYIKYKIKYMNLKNKLF